MRTIEEIKKDLRNMLHDENPIPPMDWRNIYCELSHALEAEVARLRKLTEWWPIETAPRDGTIFLVGRIWEGKADYRPWMLGPHNMLPVYYTHWRPIPPLRRRKIMRKVEEEKAMNHHYYVNCAARHTRWAIRHRQDTPERRLTIQHIRFNLRLAKEARIRAQIKIDEIRRNYQNFWRYL